MVAMTQKCLVEIQRRQKIDISFVQRALSIPEINDSIIMLCLMDSVDGPSVMVDSTINFFQFFNF